MKRIFPALAVTLVCVCFGTASGTPTGLAWLKIGVGADAVGMADAVVSNVNGPTATYWNAGALPFMEGFQAGVVHNESFQSVRSEFAGVSRNFGSFSIGGSFHGTWTDNLKAYDESANFLGEFGYYGLAVAATAGYRVHETLGAGVSVKLLQEAIDIYDASGFALDFGIQGRSVLQNLDVGFSILNIGSSMEYIDQPFDLPLTMQGGVTYHVPLASVQSELLLAAEVRKVREEDAGALLGAEYRLQDAARLRFGYRSGLDTEDVSFGLGFHRGQIDADYAYVPFGEDLGSQHRIGLTYRR